MTFACCPFGFRYYSPFVTGHIYSLRLRVSHLHNSFHTFVFRSILLPNISLSRSPHHRSPPHILLLRPLFFPSHPAHPMSSSIFSSPCHSIYTQKVHGSLFLLSHTHRDHHHISISLEPLTGRQPPLTINLTLTPTLPFAYFSFFWLILHVYILLFSLIYAEKPFLHCLL